MYATFVYRNGRGGVISSAVLPLDEIILESIHRWPN